MAKPNLYVLYVGIIMPTLKGLKHLIKFVINLLGYIVKSAECSSMDKILEVKTLISLPLLYKVYIYII